MIDLAPSERRPRRAPGRVLIVEDDADVAFVARETLEDAGYGVAIARHGAAGLEVAGPFRPDVIILDLRMPIMDGWSFVKQYRAHGNGARIVLLSGVHETREIGEQVRADAVLRKPLDLEALLATVARFVRV